ncbi:MAG: hypothetical protein LC122_13435 [Chitinophagales bacterium]|nr:hypothetical protein [Chitinophagales bacterium]
MATPKERKVLLGLSVGLFLLFGGLATYFAMTGLYALSAIVGLISAGCVIFVGHDVKKLMNGE